MNTPNPAQVASARTARLVREATTPVYSTTTPVREHQEAVEFEHSVYGNRMWVKTVGSAMDAVIAEHVAIGYDLSDIDHSAQCWCQK